MSGRKRRRKRAGHEAGQETSQATEAREKPAIVPWRKRARDVIRRLREWARDAHGPRIETYLRTKFSEGAGGAPLGDLERAFDDFVFTPGSAGDGRSLLAVFTEDAEGLEGEERQVLASWEQERRRAVYLLDRPHRDLLQLWDPVLAGRVTLHLLDRMPRGQVATLKRGTVVLATTVPYGKRIVALGEVETWDDDEAVRLFRKEVRDQGRMWQDLPPPTPA